MRGQFFTLQDPFQHTYYMQEFNSEQFNQLCQHNRQRIRKLSLDEQYLQHIEYQGRLYRYDPDYDCFYAITSWESQSYWDRWGWIWVLLALSAIALYLG